MLAEHFAAGSMDGGAGDFAAGWEWDNVMMLPGGQQHLNRKLHSAPSSAWSDEPPVMVVAPPRPPPPPTIASGSGIPGISTTAAARNSLLQSPDGAKTDANGLPASIKHESLELPRSGKPNGVIHHPSSQEKLPSNSSKDFFLGLSGGAKPEGEKNDNGGAASGDAEIGLKLGLKRAFSPDSNSVATSSAGGATTVSASAPTATTTNATNTGNKSSSPGKKPRAANHTPRCQVEGCKTDLTSAKDYHRRHKVCAMHSKSAKVSVNSIEQRFCQQCSRFHVLSEFDEGKRSCRRRLAGHNERRRKPQPDPMALTSVLSPYQAGFMRLARDERLLGYGTPLSYLGVDNVNGKLAWPRFGTLDEHPGLVSGSSSVSRPERFFMLIPPRKTPAMLSNGGAMGHQQQHQQQQQQHHHHGVHQFMQGTGSMGQNLTLSSPSAYATGIGIGPPNPAAGSSPHGVNVAGVSDSGRALSLLSSQSWTASPSPHDSMEQLMSENRAAYSSSQQQQQPGTSYVSLSQQQVAGGLQVAALDSRNGNHQSQQQQQQGGSGGGSGGGGGGGASFLPGMNNYENHTVLTLLQESELRNLQDQQQQHARPTIDLMHMSTTPPASAVVIQQQQQQQQQQSPSDFQVLKPYGSGLYDPHHL